MESNFEQLKNNATLAPLQEEKLTEFYTPKSMNNRDATILATISKSSISAIESTIGTLTHLIQNLKVYKECMIDSINLQAESADIATKYSNEIPQQANVLPGVISIPHSYDLNAIKSDNERMMQIKDERDKVTTQKDIYLRVAREDVRLFLGAWRRLTLSDSQYDEFIESLNNEINKNY